MHPHGHATMKRNDLDLASRGLGGSVRYVNDEFFAPREALILPGASVHDTTASARTASSTTAGRPAAGAPPGTTGRWSIRCAGFINEIIVDTAWFRGNYPPEISVEATWVDGSPDEDTLQASDWVEIVPRSAARGDSRNTYRVHNHYASTHVRLNIFPTGGGPAARARHRGPDPRLLGSRIDLAAIHHGGDIAMLGHVLFGRSSAALSRRRPVDGGRLGDRQAAGERQRLRRGHAGGSGPPALHRSRHRHFLGNAPGSARLPPGIARGPVGGDPAPRRGLTGLSQPVQADHPADDVTAVRVDVYPDGGFSRLHLYGELAPTALGEAIAHWLRMLPPAAYSTMLARVRHSVRAGAGSDRRPAPAADLVSRVPTLAEFNAAADSDARRLLDGCLDIDAWVQDLASHRPYLDVAELQSRGATAAARITWTEVAQALARHPRIGEQAQGSEADRTASATKQSGVRADQRDDLARRTPCTKRPSGTSS